MRTSFVWAAALAATLLASSAFSQGRSISIGTGGTGGVYYPLGGGMANLISTNIPGMQASAEVTGGSIDNIRLLSTGKSELGIVQSDAAYDAMLGQDKFKGMKVPVRSLIALYPSRMHVVTVESTQIRKFSDLRGKRISTGSAGSGTEVMAFRMLEAAGIDREKDVRRERLGVSESVNAIKDGKIDAFFFAGGIPTAAVTDLAATPGTKIRLIDTADLVDVMAKKYGPLYARDAIPAKSYSGQDAPNQITSAWNLLIAHERMSDADAYAIVKTIFENLPYLVTVHKEAQNIDLKNQSSATSSIPYHPGAARYFAEKGITLK
jgi:TRAP transporter TAXI family solute receptor